MIFEDGRVVGCGVIITNWDGKVLLGKRSDGQGWCLAGGKVEEDETYEESAKRELYEEFGITATNVSLVGITTSDAIVSGVQKKVKSYIFFADAYIMPRNELVPNEEIVEFKWMWAEDILESNDIFPPTLKSITLYLNRLLQKQERSNFNVSK